MTQFQQAIHALVDAEVEFVIIGGVAAASTGLEDFRMPCLSSGMARHRQLKRLTQPYRILGNLPSGRSRR